MIQGLPKDVFRYLLRPLMSPISLIRLQSTNKWFYELFRNDTQLERWRKLAVNGRLNYCIENAAQEGHRDLVELFIFKSCKEIFPIVWNNALYRASRGGHQDLVDWLISKGANYWDWGLEGASEGGHRELVDFFISKFEKSGIPVNWNRGLWGASKGGHRDLVDFFNSKMTSHTPPED